MTRAQVSLIKKMLPCLYILFTLNIIASIGAITWFMMVLLGHNNDLFIYAAIVGTIGVLVLPLSFFCFFTLITNFRSSLKIDHQTDRTEKRKRLT
ncbi:hypothetical protein I6N95_07290 [Vagococcus sp. BWB3-3]|uniref:Uncharacterized protein n=1 Tax=Vagococcus allomyrinae TaxID=2794353 RepID=A0A940P3F3_9ENTE|nr:hypothetical protein [Vagococcus allomyrinae]MBP1040804.1 hypothetical protein [Vagococcus allomyrinae]